MPGRGTADPRNAHSTQRGRARSKQPKAPAKGIRTTRAPDKMPVEDVDTLRNRNLDPKTRARAQMLRQGRSAQVDDAADTHTLDDLDFDFDATPDDVEPEAAEEDEEGDAWTDADFPPIPDPPPMAAPWVDSEPQLTPDGEEIPVSQNLVAAAESARARGKRNSRGAMTEWQVEWVKLTTLMPANYNPRIMPQEEMESLKGSLREFGWVEPVVVNTFQGRAGVIVGGHQRCLAAFALSQDPDEMHGAWERVPVVWVYEPVEREKALNLALNRIHGHWDERKLGELIVDLHDTAPGALDLSGFTTDEVADMVAGFGDMPDPFEFGNDFDSDRTVKQVEVIVRCAAGEYDDEIAEHVRNVIADLREDYPSLTVQVKRGTKEG